MDPLSWASGLCKSPGAPFPLGIWSTTWGESVEKLSVDASVSSLLRWSGDSKCYGNIKQETGLGVPKGRWGGVCSSHRVQVLLH